MEHNLRIVFWNVCGLNAPAKRTAIRSVITSASPCTVCIQETKMISLSSSLVAETLGPSFSEFFLLPADGTRGGILPAWRPDMIAALRSLSWRAPHHRPSLLSRWRASLVAYRRLRPARR
ncbi:hypothetical protein VPH35_125277 [Triticum aestivum]